MRLQLHQTRTSEHEHVLTVAAGSLTKKSQQCKLLPPQIPCARIEQKTTEEQGGASKTLSFAKCRAQRLTITGVVS
jgi:hypothetical protein